MEITLKGKAPSHPRDAVLAIEEVTRALCQTMGKDPAEGVMMLLTAAVHLAVVHSDKSYAEAPAPMADALGSAIGAAEGWFGGKDPYLDLVLALGEATGAAPSNNGK